MNAEAERWKLVEDLFHRASEQPPDQRRRLLEDWCGSDDDLLRRVLDLLGADSQIEQLISSSPVSETSGFLTRDPIKRSPPPALDDSSLDPNQDPWIGRSLGPYTLQRLLGRGGMGVVYLAERTAAGLNQTVAVKLMARHLHSSPAVNQFLLERQVLAQLEHPHIARLLDGGVTEEGFPYVVMEFVEGRRLDAACDDPATTLDQILRWMLQLCDAVAYVHRNLILHRDLKPGNVMVTDDGQVKLLDFGTLKRIGPDSQESSAMTQAGMRPVTVRYASPEHIAGTQVSTAADVYSLGVILYRLLAGRLPIGAHDEKLDDLPLGQYLDFLQSSPFKAPSQVAKESHGRAIPPHLARDLDAIVAKALRFEPEARYSSAQALGTDLSNLLSNLPVTAREGNLQYHATKFYRRHTWPVRVAAAALVVLLCGISGMAWQGHLAHLQELRAEKGVEDERLLVHMLLSDYFEELSLIPGSIEAQRKAVTQSLNYLDNLARTENPAQLDPRLRLDLVKGYTDMGNLLGNPYEQNLGNAPEALISLEKAFSLAKTSVQRSRGDLTALFAFVSAGYGLGETYLGNGDAATAERVLSETAQGAAKLVANPKATGPMIIEASGALDSLGDVYDPGRGFITANPQKALLNYQLSSDYLRRCLEIDPRNDLCRSSSVVDEYKFGSFLEDPDPAAAAAHYQTGLNTVLKFPPEMMKTTRSHRLKNYMLSRLGLMKLRLGSVDEGMSLATEALDGFHEAIAKSQLDNRARFDLVAFETDLAPELSRLGKLPQAEEAAKDVLNTLAVLLQRSPGNTRWQMIRAEDWLTEGRLEAKLGHAAQSAEAVRKGIEEALRLAQAKDASPDDLLLAANGLLEFRPAEAKLALNFAERSAKAYAKPTAAQLLTLAKAQSAVGDRWKATQTASLALAALPDPQKSSVVAEQVAQARQLIQ
jgi:non-specific serine/threonine protein kinase/serine/threonine-protein kinase